MSTGHLPTEECMSKIFYKYSLSHCLWITSFFQNVCQILWCSVNGSCRSKLDSPIDGTRCGPDKVDDARVFVLLGFRFHSPRDRDSSTKMRVVVAQSLEY